MRDSADAPLQTIEAQTAVARLHHADAATNLARIERALRRLHELDGLLSKHEAHVRWRKEDESFDAVERLRGDGGS